MTGPCNPLPQPPLLQEGQQLGWRLFPLPLEVRMAWEKLWFQRGRGETETAETFLARKSRGRRNPESRVVGVPGRAAERLKKPLDSGCREQGRNQRVGSAGERERAAPEAEGQNLVPDSRGLGRARRAARLGTPSLTGAGPLRGRRRRRRWPRRVRHPLPQTRASRGSLKGAGASAESRALG